jgi:hypothetical protein
MKLNFVTIWLLAFQSKPIAVLGYFNNCRWRGMPEATLTRLCNWKSNKLAKHGYKSFVKANLGFEALEKSLTFKAGEGR